VCRAQAKKQGEHGLSGNGKQERVRERKSHLKMLLTAGESKSSKVTLGALQN
jgi:hypothetical protein